MVRLTRTIAIGGLSIGLALTGCTKESGTAATGTPPADNGGDPAKSGGTAPPNHGGDKSAMRGLGSVTIGGSSLKVSVAGAIQPNTAVNVDVTHTGGPLPAVLRLWIGDASATGSLKSKADGHGDHFHGHVEAPADLGADTAIWIEVESASGDRVAGSLPLS